MDYLHLIGLKISRLALGTSQFGSAYGLSNRVGQPSKSDVKDILTLALDGGINVLDTARLYGDSEAWIGELLASHPLSDLVVVTKLKQIPLDAPWTPAQLEAEVDDSIHTSLKHLRLKVVPIYLMHNPLHLTAFGGALVEQMLRLRTQGLVQHIGVSVYTPQEADLALDTEGIEAIEVPFNVFDYRLVASGFFQRAHAQGVVVFVRSVYLKGLVVLDLDEVPEYVNEAVPVKERFNKICARFGRSPVEAALKYPLTVTSGTSVLTGVEQASQVEANLKLFNAPPLADDMVVEIRKAFREVPQYVLDPRQWPPAYAPPQKRAGPKSA